VGRRALVLLSLLLLTAGPLRATEGFESGLGNWTPSGLWQRVVSPACVSPHAGAACLYFGRSGLCDYNDHLIKDASVTSGPVSLTDPARAFISFWVLYQVESDQPSCFDQLRLEHSQDGVNWTLLQKVSPSSDPPGGSAGMGLASGSGVGGTPLWQYKRVDLSAFLGQVLYLRFRFVSSGQQAGDTACLETDADFDAFLGYALDDINFYENPEPVAIVKSVAPAYGIPGTAVTYKIVATNRDSASQNLAVWDSLPAGTSFVSASNAGSLGGGVVSWSLPSVPSNGAVTVSLQVNVSGTASVPQDILNVASSISSVSGPQQDSSPALFMVRSNGVSLRKTVDNGSITTGDVVTYAILLQNFSALTETALALQEQLPGGFTLSGTDPGIGSNNQWLLTPVTPGDVRSFTVQGPLSGEDGQVLVNTAVLQQAGAALASASASVTVHKPFAPQITLKAVYPNPAPGNSGFGRGVHIAYELNQSLPMTLDIFTMAGEKLRTLDVPGTRGVQDVVWDLTNDFGHDVASGVYVIRLWSATQKGPVPQAFGYVAVLR
jgi:uncharacterized repeat protein (TIGR01451 family)